jgi:tRNA 2-thiouridine synthesizing protein A
VRRPLPLTLVNSGEWRLDCLGMLCPVPVVKTGQAIRKVELGDVLTVVADDPGVELDLKDWCSANRQEWLDVAIEGSTYTTRIRRLR